MAAEQTPTESSPLLGATNGNVSTGAIDIPREESGHIERSQGDQGKDPFPDAHKQLKLIIPAISLGVRIFYIVRIVITDPVYRFSYLLQIRRLSWPAMAKLEVI